MSRWTAMPEPRDARALAERLIAIPSVSPDPAGESRCADFLAAHLPAETVHGAWTLPDGRPVVWALIEGRWPRTVLMLGHYDTVSARGFAAPDPEGDQLAFDSPRCRDRLLEQRRRGARFDEVLEEDLAREEREPGTWMFGRGSLDMKAGLAAGVAAMEALVRGPRDGHVLFAATPDEEHASAGMLAAVPEIVRLREARGLDLLGAINLDLVAQPGAYHGAAGKLAIGLLVLGVPAHVGAASEGIDAAQLAAAIAMHATTASDWFAVTGLETEVLPALLSLRDLKQGYDVQTTTEAFVELNVVRGDVSLARVFVAMERVVRDAAAKLVQQQGPRNERRFAWDSPPRFDRWPESHGWKERLVVRPLAELPGADERIHWEQTSASLVVDPVPLRLTEQRTAALREARERVARAGIAGPAVIMFLLPPYYPPRTARSGSWSQAASRLLEREQLEWLGSYPFISDACYCGWDGESLRELAPHLPGIDRLGLPEATAARLDLDVVTLGPWGREPHGRFERVHAPYAFERLPRMLVEMIGDALSSE